MKNTYFVIAAFVCFSSVVSAQIPTNGLIAYYPFSGSAGDSSGFGNHGVVNGATLTTDRFGAANSAYLFNGTSDYISAPNSSSLQSPSSQFTLSAWVNVDDLAERHWVLDKRINPFSAPYSSWAIYASDNTSSQVWLTQRQTSSNSIDVAASSTTIANSWVNLVSVYDGNQISMYVNGIFQNSESAFGNIIYSTLPLYIGTSGNTVAFLKGKIDDIRIYDRALSLIEIATLSNEGTVGINTFNFNTIEIFPNPANDHITVDLRGFPAQGNTLTITNVLGEVLFTAPVSAEQSYIDLSDRKGNSIYFVRLADKQNNILFTRKIVLQ